MKIDFRAFGVFGLSILGLPLFVMGQTAVSPVKAMTIFERLKPMEKPPAKTIFPSVIDPAQAVIVTLTNTNSSSLLELAQTMAKIQTKARLVIMTPESFDPLVGKQKSRVLSVQNFLRKDLAKTVGDKVTVEFLPTSYLQYSWPQDLGKFFWFQNKENKNWHLGFLDLNRGNRALKSEKWPLDSKTIFKNELPLEEPQLLVDRLKTHFNFEILRLPANTREFEGELSANHGANLEFAPGGFAMTGSNAPGDMRELLEKWTGHPLLALDTKFAQSGQLALNYALVPSGATCGYSLLVASPLQGLQARKNESFKAAQSNLTEFYEETLFYYAKNPNLKVDVPVKISDFDLGREARRYNDRDLGPVFAGQFRFVDFTVLKTLKAEADLEKAARDAQNFFKTQKICENLEIIRIPVIAQIVDPNEYFENENGVGTDSRVQNYAPITNLIVVDGHLIMGDFANVPGKGGAELKIRTQKALAQGRVPMDRQHFITSAFYNEGLGSIGSSALVLRRPAEIPSESPAKTQ